MAKVKAEAKRLTAADPSRTTPISAGPTPADSSATPTPADPTMADLTIAAMTSTPAQKKDLFGVCPYVTAQKLLAGKWSIVILHHLSEGPIRFNELLRRLPQMTHATLSKQLKALEENNLIIRTEYPQIPPKVEYALSPIGEKFRPVLDSLQVWGSEFIAYRNSEETQ